MKLISNFFISFVGLLVSASAVAGKIYTDFPLEIKADQSYVIYSHGYIVEGTNPKPIDQRFGWGLYDFPKIKKALSDDSYNLIAIHRPKNTDPFEFATKLSMEIRKLTESGVKPGRITIVGFSRGAFITGLTSDKLSDLQVNTIILAGCGRLVSKNHTDIKVYGHVLSIYEKTDRANTCEKLKQKSRLVKSFTELEINTGLEHGAFYRPIPEWIGPVKEWIKARHNIN